MMEMQNARPPSAHIVMAILCGLAFAIGLVGGLFLIGL